MSKEIVIIMALTSRQITRNIIWWVIFFIVMIGLPIFYFGFYTVGTVCWSDPFFHMQNLVIHGANQGLWGYFSSTNAISLLGFSLISLIVFTLVFGRAFCSWICPFGAMLDFTGKLSKLMETEHKELPEVVKDRNIKYGVLIGFIAIAAFLGRAVFCDFCPLGTFYRTTGPYAYSFPWLMLFPLAILFGFLFIAYFYKPRAWCMYVCPLGAFIAAEDKISMMRVQLPSDSCIECKQCEKICPMDIPIMKDTRYKLLHDPKVKKVLIKYVTCQIEAILSLLAALNIEDSGLITNFIRKLTARMQCRKQYFTSWFPTSSFISINWNSSSVISH